jgi:phytoene dehydrogenase-like protein
VVDSDIDAVVVGAGPNGLAAALTLAERGLTVRVYESAPTPGGGCRTADLTLDGFRHDVCASVHALARVSPFFRTLDLERSGVQFAEPEIAFAHPLGGDRAAALYRDVAGTADELGTDGPAWTRLFGPLARDAEVIWPDILGPLRSVPRHPLTMGRLAVPAVRSIAGLAKSRFAGEEARALLAGVGAHSMRRLDAPFTAAFGLVLITTAHTANWPVIRGGSGVLVTALVDRLRSLGGEVVCDTTVTDLAQLPSADLTILDVTPHQLLSIAGDRLPAWYRTALARYRYGPGVCKVDWALKEPVPWAAAECRAAGTVHVGGTLTEIARSERDVERGRHPDAPYVLVVQPTLMDPSRAPDGHHTLWAYCHVPAGSTHDMTDVIERQIERFAPGFTDTIIGRSSRTAADFESYDANYVGGNILGGRASLTQTLFGPTPGWSRYKTPLKGVYLCSSSTPPGGGVHGMCGYWAAREALATFGPTSKTRGTRREDNHG